MTSRILRALVILAALAAQAGAGYRVWTLEQRTAAERAAGDAFDRQARQMTLGLADLRGAFQAYVADGQNTTVWQRSAADLLQAATTQGAGLRAAAVSPEGQGAVEEALELLGSLGRTDARARNYLASGERLSASDVVFAEAAATINRAAGAIDVARGHEGIGRAGSVEQVRLQQVYVLAGAAGVTLIALLLLFPVPRRSEAVDDGGPSENVGSSLGISHVTSASGPSRARPAREEPPEGRAAAFAAPPAAPAQDLIDAADLCVALARVQEPRELPALLERAAHILQSAGIIIWMPEGPTGALRPALAHGYAPIAITRMGSLAVDADNATAEAFRTQTAQRVPPEGDAGGAIVAPLVTAEGCSGVMAAELRHGVVPTDTLQALAGILAAQLAMLISPAAAAGEAGR